MLRHKQDEFRILTENMSEGFLVVDKNTEILSYNSSALKLLGVSEGKNETETKHTLSGNESFKSTVFSALSGEHNEQVIQLENRFYHIIANPVYEDERINGVILIIIDVTEKELREKMRSEFTSTVSHELKTPLTSIYGVSDMLMAGLVRPEDITEFAKSIHDEAGRLISLVNDIIKLSQLDENVVPIEKTEVDLYDLCNDVLNRLHNSIDEKHISVTLSGEHAIITGVSVVLDELVHNLCDNAVKYNKENGEINVNVTHSDGHIILTVADTGIGIPQKQVDRVFERFYRVDKSHSKKIGGTGLGLSIVKHAAGFHGGTVRIESKENVGTKVTVTLPPEYNR